MATPNPSIVVPLYMYPLHGAWVPLFAAARAHPDVTFIAIVNPNSGPGSDTLPDASYLAVLREMANIANIQPLGYVHCSYGQRASELLSRDIDLYRLWNISPDSGLKVDGIFFDEAPSDPELAEYMSTAAKHVYSTWRRDLDLPGQVMLNPGVVVADAYFDQADHVVVFEQSEAHWETYFAPQGLAQITDSQRGKAVAIVHSCGASREGLEKLVREVKLMGLGGVYLTEQHEGGYSQWPEQLDHIVATAKS